MTKDFIKQMKESITQLSGVGDVVPNNQVVQSMLWALPKSYNPLVQAIMCQDQLPNFKHLCGKLALEESRRGKDHGQHEALSMTRVRKYFSSYYNNSKMASMQPPKGGSMPNVTHMKAPKGSRIMRRGTCNNYGKWGHFSRECPHRSSKKPTH